MMIIDSDDYAAAGIQTLFFPGGEPHAKLTRKLPQSILLVLRLRTWHDVGIAACVIELLGEKDTHGVSLFIPYFPGARQDKGSPLTGQMIASLLGCDWFDTDVFDIHSDSAYRQISAKTNWMPRDLGLVPMPLLTGIIAPDAGSIQRAASFRDAYAPHARVLMCTKERNPDTGALSHFVMPELPRTGRYMIVDDICDGGGTFNLLAEAFVKDRCGESSSLELFVSHGIFSKGLNAIHPKIWKITTTDSLCAPSWDPRLKVIPLSPLYAKITGDEPHA